MLQTRERNIQTLVDRILTWRMRAQTPYRRRMIYRLAWSIVFFMTQIVAQDANNRAVCVTLLTRDLSHAWTALHAHE
jgi:hypothetical protein